MRNSIVILLLHGLIFWVVIERGRSADIISCQVNGQPGPGINSDLTIEVRYENTEHGLTTFKFFNQLMGFVHDGDSCAGIEAEGLTITSCAHVNLTTYYEININYGMSISTRVQFQLSNCFDFPNTGEHFSNTSIRAFAKNSTVWGIDKRCSPFYTGALLSSNVN